jgi:aquaporin Z
MNGLTHAKTSDQETEFSLPRALTAEMFGAFLLTFIDAGVGIVNHETAGAVGPLGQSLGPVAVVSTMIFLIGEVSGAHINPAVTFAFALRRVFPWRRVWLYLVAQFFGAAVAGFLIYLCFQGSMHYGLTEPHRSFGLVFTMETLLTWFLITSIVTCSCASSVKGWEAAFPVGATLLFCGLLGKEISGASMNPARSFGSAWPTGDFSTLWIYLTAPFLGAFFGTITTLIIRGPPSEKEVMAARGD